jgi:ribosomal protein S12 methylthiotransferase
LQRIRLLYLYPSEVRDLLLTAMFELSTVVPYFDLSLQHASASLLRRMKRWGSRDRFIAMIEKIRAQDPAAAFRSSFIVGFPGGTESDHEELLQFLSAAQLDWAGFFPFSEEEGTSALALDGKVDPALMHDRLRECSEVQDPITDAGRRALVGDTVEVLVDRVEDDGLIGRTFREAPEIDGIVRIVGAEGRAGAFVRAEVTGAMGPDLEARGT